MPIASVNPATGKTLAEFEADSGERIDHVLDEAVAAQRALRRMSFDQRAALMRRAAGVLDEDGEHLAGLMTAEMGKTLVSARAEVAKCALGMRYYAEHAERFLAPRRLPDPAEVGASEAGAVHQPLGVVLAVMPWNFPAWQVIRFAAPALMAGNAGVLKHASNVPQTALYLATVFARAGFPAGAFSTLLVGSGAVAGIVADDRVAAVTLTGSEAAGVSVAEAAGRALKKSVLELGGSDPFVVLPSADLARAAQAATASRVQNTGQSCICAKRFIVHTDVYEPFVELFAAGMAAVRHGDPRDGATDMGPLSTGTGRRDITDLVADAVARGASVTVGGQVPDGPGFFYPATLVEGVDRSMLLWSEEAFGPVATVIRVRDTDEALAVANDSVYGLSSSVWTHDEGERQQAIRDIEAGAVFVNGMSASFPALPFGGIKRSGYGRELAAQGIREFCNVKTVWTA